MYSYLPIQAYFCNLLLTELPFCIYISVINIAYYNACKINSNNRYGFIFIFLVTGENTPEHSSNAEATAMAIVEEDSPEIIHFQEFQNTPVSSAVIICYFLT